MLDAVNEALRRDAQQRAAPLAAGLDERLQELTPREREVLDLALKGNPSKMIARVLGISHRTVELHRSNLLEKLGVASIADLMRVNHGPGV